MDVQNYKRIYEDPKHPHYGPVRRMHMMLTQLFADKVGGLAGFEDRMWNYQRAGGARTFLWDESLHRLLLNRKEAEAQRHIMVSMMAHHDRVG